MSACVGRRGPRKDWLGLLGNHEGRVEKIYLSKGSLPDASEEDEVEKVDIGIKVNDL